MRNQSCGRAASLVAKHSTSYPGEKRLPRSRQRERIPLGLGGWAWSSIHPSCSACFTALKVPRRFLGWEVSELADSYSLGHYSAHSLKRSCPQNKGFSPEFQMCFSYLSAEVHVWQTAHAGSETIALPQSDHLHHVFTAWLRFQHRFGALAAHTVP